MSDSGTLVIIGSGPGIGVAVAKHFASKTFKTVALLARREAQLQKDKAAVLEKASGAHVETFVVDISDLGALKTTLTKVEKLGAVGCVIFNAARVAPSKLLETDVEFIEEDFKVTNLALYETARWVVPLFKNTKVHSPSVLVTNSMLYKAPFSFVFSLSLVKSAQRTLVMTLKDDFKDIHFGLVSVEGQVSPDKANMSPDFIAGKFWDLYSQPKDRWTWEMEVLE